MATSPTPLSVYQLRIVLRGISPLLWRRVHVRTDLTLARLHALLQLLFAWSDEPRHSFHIHGKEYGSSGAQTLDIRLRDLCLHRGARFRYVYDFGTYRECDMRLEAMLPQTVRQGYPVCTGGKRATPPADCRGAWDSLERLDRPRRYPPLEAMGVVAEAVSTL